MKNKSEHLTNSTRINLLFVCLGNICRSPAAEAVMKSKVKAAGLEHRIDCDSAGILGFHSGKPADLRMRNQGSKRGYHVSSLSRQIRPGIDFARFDMIIGMDDLNIVDLNELAISDNDRKKIFRITDFCVNKTASHVPDPYYGEPEDFNLVLDLLEDACDGLLVYLKKRLNS